MNSMSRLDQASRPLVPAQNFNPSGGGRSGPSKPQHGQRSRAQPHWIKGLVDRIRHEHIHVPEGVAEKARKHIGMPGVLQENICRHQKRSENFGRGLETN